MRFIVQKSPLSLRGGDSGTMSARTWCQRTVDHWAEPTAKVPAPKCCYPIAYANASAFINNIARILHVQRTLVKHMCSSKLIASTARARLQFLLGMNSLTPKANPGYLDAFDAPAWSMAFVAYGIHRIKMFCDCLPKMLLHISPGQLVKITSSSCWRCQQPFSHPSSLPEYLFSRWRSLVLTGTSPCSEGWN